MGHPHLLRVRCQCLTTVQVNVFLILWIIHSWFSTAELWCSVFSNVLQTFWLISSKLHNNGAELDGGFHKVWDPVEVVCGRARLELNFVRHWRTDIRESHYMWKDSEISSLCPSALETTISLCHCTGGASQDARTWKRDGKPLLPLDVPREGQHLLCTGPRPSSVVAVAAQLLGWITFAFPALRGGVMGVGAQGVWRIDGSHVLALLTYKCFAPCSLLPLYNFGLDLRGLLVEETCHVSSSSWGNTDALSLKTQKDCIFFSLFYFISFPKDQCLSQAPLSLVRASAWVSNSHLIVKLNYFLLYLWKQNCYHPLNVFADYNHCHSSAGYNAANLNQMTIKLGFMLFQS